MVLSITVNDVLVPELQFIIQEDQAQEKGKQLVTELAKKLPMQDFPVRVGKCRNRVAKLKS